MIVDDKSIFAATDAYENQLTVTGELDATRPQTALRLASGRTVVLPTQLILDSTYQLEPAFGAATQAVATSAGAMPVVGTQGDLLSRGAVVPLVAESMMVGKQTVTTGTVRLRRTTEEFTGSVNVPLTTVGWQVDRIAVNAVVAERPDIRVEGETTVYPLVEERLVAKREYLLREEVRVTRVVTTTERTATMPLTRDVLTEEREPAVSSASGTTPRIEDVTLVR